MKIQKRFGRDAASGRVVEIAFGETVFSAGESDAATELYLAPGFVDLQVNGFAGVDFNRPDQPAEEIDRALRAALATGVTRLLPTVITASPEHILAALRNLTRARRASAVGRAVAGFHVEGPHIAGEDGPRGAHPRAWVRTPSIEEFRSWMDASEGLLRVVTLAPEYPEASRYIEAVVAHGVVAAIGHTAATGAQIADAVSAGASLSTHLGNGAHAVLRRHPNYLWEQLAADRLMASFIADGIHLDAPFLKTAFRAKGAARTVLVTDAASPAAALPGTYNLGEQKVELTPGGRVVLAGTDRLAGSALTMNRAVTNLMRLAGATLADAIAAATVNAARAGGIAGRARGLVPGEKADFLFFRFETPEDGLRVVETWIDGERV
ncbi:MAG: amidohydrolase family protein [Bryobacteraceae bacterium]|jgi:N-acetylglucosamine-6-phosphate deacetylase